MGIYVHVFAGKKIHGQKYREIEKSQTRFSNSQNDYNKNAKMGNIKSFGCLALLLSTVVAGFALAATEAGESLRPSTQSYYTESSSANSKEEEDGTVEAFAQHRSRMLELLGTEGRGGKNIGLNLISRIFLLLNLKFPDPQCHSDERIPRLRPLVYVTIGAK